MRLDAFLLVMAAACLHATWNFAARRAAGHQTVIWLGMALAAVAVAPAAAWFLVAYPPTTRALWCVLATGIIHGFYFTLVGKAYEKGEISVVYPLARGTGVAGAGIAAWSILGERVSVTGGVGIGCVGVGSILLALGARRRADLHAVGFALLVGATIVVYSLVDKVGVAGMHPVSYALGLWGLGSITALPYFIGRGHHKRWRQAVREFRWTIVLVGPGSLVTYLLVLFAMRLDQASYVVAAREVAVVLGAVLGVVALKERATPLKVAAVGAILAGLVLIKVG